jgi:tetratricopeptide (TPR) repeat protein
VNQEHAPHAAYAPWVFPAACLAALAVLIGAYSNSFQNSFHFDDAHIIERNLYIRSLKNLPLFFRDANTFSSTPSNATYRPLVSATLALDYWLGGGLNVRQFHVSQLAMLIALGVMLFFLALWILDAAEQRWWNRYVALATAAFFTMHTTNTETMNIIHVRSELLSVMGVVGSFLVYLGAPRSRPWRLYLIPMIIGAFAKSPAVIFAPLLLVYVLLFEERLSAPDLFVSRAWPGHSDGARPLELPFTRPRRERPVVDAVVTCLPAFLVAGVVYLFVAGMDAPTVKQSYPGIGGFRWDYLQTQAFAWLHYGRLFVLPVGLSADTDWALIQTWYDTRVLAGVCFVAALLRIAWMSSKTPPLRPVAFGILWFCIALVPTSSIIPLTEPMNEHRPFFAFVGLSLATATGLAELARRTIDRWPRLRPAVGPAVWMCAVLVLGGHAVGAYERNKVFRTEETLWLDVTQKSPANGRGLMNYGLTQMALGRYETAKEFFDRAHLYAPDYWTLETNLGIVAERLGQSTVAEAHFKRALQLQPISNAQFFYGRWLLERGRTPEAIAHLQRAVAVSPADPAARHLLLDAYARTRRTAELKALIEDTLRVVPDDREVLRFLDDRGDVVLPQASTTPSVPAADSLLSTSLQRYQAGDFQGCIDAARQALALQPDSAAAYNNMAAAFASLRRWDDAIAAAHAALRLQPDFPLARNNLAWAERERQRAGPAAAR